MTFGAADGGTQMKELFKKGPGSTVEPVSNDPTQDVSFVEAGIRAAKNSRNGTRNKVIQDLSETLGCDPNALRFMFSDLAPKTDPRDFDFPDSERRRQVIRLNGWDVAE